MPTEPELRFVFDRLPAAGRVATSDFCRWLPGAGPRGQLERYILGPASLAKFEPRISPSLAGFHFVRRLNWGASRSTERTWFSSC